MRRPTPTATTTDTREDKFILSVDIGTTQSAVAVYYKNKQGVVFRLCFLRQTDIARTEGSRQPLVTHVSRWPGQEAAMYDEKVPSALMYDDQGTVGF